MGEMLSGGFAADEEPSYEALSLLQEESGGGDVCTGLSAAEQARLQRSRVSLLRSGKRKRSSSSVDCPSCAVCLMEWEDGDEVIVLRCDHAFHADHVLPWLAQKPTCPVCKADCRDG